MYYFIVNLASRTGRAMKTWKMIKKELNSREVAYKAYLTEYPGHAGELAKKITNLEDDDIRLIVVGGDGTINEVINGMQHFDKVRFGFIPSGSGNDLGRGLGVSAKDPMGALERILNAEEDFRMDLGRVFWEGEPEGRQFAISAGAGFDALVCELVSKSRLKKALNKVGLGKLVYMLITFRSMAGITPRDAVVTFDDEEPVPLKKMIFAAAMNQPCEGGGVPMTPHADATDGKLSIICVDNEPKILLPILFVCLLCKKHAWIKKCKLREVKSFHIQSSEPIVVHSDGEFCGYRKNIKYVIEPAKLRMLYTKEEKIHE